MGTSQDRGNPPAASLNRIETQSGWAPLPKVTPNGYTRPAKLSRPCLGIPETFTPFLVLFSVLVFLLLFSFKFRSQVVGACAGLGWRSRLGQGCVFRWDLSAPVTPARFRRLTRGSARTREWTANQVPHLSTAPTRGLFLVGLFFFFLIHRAFKFLHLYKDREKKAIRK